MDLTTLESMLGPQLTAEQAQTIFAQGQEAVIFALITTGNCTWSPHRRREKGPKEPKAAPAGPILYNLKTDPAETTDMSAANPDVVARLKAMAAERDAEIRANQRPASKVDD